MNSWLRMAVVGGLVLGLAGAAMAQPGRGQGRGGQGRGGIPGGGFGGGSLALLRDENVRKDLKVTDDQIKKLDEFQAKSRDAMRQAFQGLRDLSNEERQAKFREMQTKSAEMTAAAEKEILLPTQIDRLKQISVQSRLNRGSLSTALTGDALASELGITEAQKEALRKAQEESDAHLREESTKLRDAARQKIINVLTAEQQAKLKSLTGETIQFSRPGRGGAGGRSGTGGRSGRTGGRPGGAPLGRPAQGD